MGAFLLRIFIFLSLYFALDWYVFQGVRTALQDISSDIFRKSVYWFYWLFNAGMLVTLAMAMFRMNSGEERSYFWISLFLGLFFLAVLPKVIFGLILSVEDIGRFFYATWEKFSGGGELQMPSRRSFISKLGLGISGLMFGSVLHGITVGKYNYKVKNVGIKFPDLPPEFHGFKITQISDVHSGSFDNIDRVAEGIDLINQQKSDIIVFTGDLVNSLAEEMNPYVDIFAKLTAPQGKYSILGNHDYASYHRFGSKDSHQENMDRLFQVHKDIGFDLLNNENRTIKKGDAEISVVGVENWGHSRYFPKKGDLDQAVKGLPQDIFKVLLSHDPSHWDHKILEHETHFPLTLSGHTHGGQFGIEIPGLKWSPIKFRYKRWSGLYKEAAQHLYVNQGFGYLAFPGRVGMPPEITVITLQKA